MKRLVYTLLLTTLLTSSGCAVFNRNNTPALNFVEKNLIPKEDPAKTLSYPLTLPIGLVAASMDMFVFHPASVVSESWNDTTDMLWSKMHWNTQYATTTASLIPRAALTPVVFTGDFLFRSTFDVNGKRTPVKKEISKEEYARQQEEKKRAEQAKIMLAREAFNRGNYAEAIALSDKLLAANSYLYDITALKASALLESGQLETLAAMPQYSRIFSNREFVSRYAAHLTKAAPADTLRLLSTLEKHNISRPSAAKNRPLTKEQQDLFDSQTDLYVALSRLFEHNDRAIRLRTIQVAGKRLSEMKELRGPLENIASSTDPVMAVAAKEALPAARK